MTPEVPNLFTYLPAALRYFPRYLLTGSQADHDAMIAAGFAPGSEFLWNDHYAVYWDLSQRAYREELDPAFDGPLPGGIPFCQPGAPMCDADYDYAARGEGVRNALRKVEVDGDIGRPMLTVHGTLDALLPIATNADMYRRFVAARGKLALHRYYVIENGNHVDGRYDLFPSRIRPIWPCWTVAMAALDAWVDRGVRPPPSQFVPDRRAGVDVANQCSLGSTAGIGPLADPADQVQRARPRGIRIKARRRGARRVRVTGTVLLPKGTTRAQACGSGAFLVRVVGRRARPRMSPKCSFATTLRLTRRLRRTDRVRVRWQGNRALAPISSRPRRVP